MLVNAGFVREGVLANDGFVPLNVDASQRAHQPRGGIDPLRIDAGPAPEEIVPGAQGHYDFLKTAIARTFAQAVDRALDLPRAGTHGRQRIRHGQPEIVVAVHADHRAIDVPDVLPQVPDDLGKMLGRGVPDGVGYVDRRRAGVDARLDDLCQERRLSP